LYSVFDGVFERGNR